MAAAGGGGPPARPVAAPRSAAASSTSWSIAFVSGPPAAPRVGRTQRPRLRRGGRPPSPAQAAAPLGDFSARVVEVQQANIHAHACRPSRTWAAYIWARQRCRPRHDVHLSNPAELPVFFCSYCWSWSRPCRGGGRGHLQVLQQLK